MTTHRPRLLFVSYTSDWTGPTNSLTLLLRYLREHYDVAVLVPGEGLFTEKMRQENLPIFSVGSLKRKAIWGIRKLIQREGFDLVYGNNSSGTSRNALIAAKLAGKPFICHVREMGWTRTWGALGYLRFCNAVIAVSQACADSVARFVPAKRLHVVHNGIPLEKVSLSRDQARAQLLAATGFSPDDVLVTNVAHVCERKGQLYAVEALAQVIPHAPNTRLVLIGSLDREPEYVAKVEAHIHEKGVNSHVKMLGFREDAVELMCGADLFMHTANKEPHPRAVIEAMGMGLAGAAFAADGVVETIVHDQTGYLAPVAQSSELAQAIVRLASDPKLRDSMGRAGKERVEAHFSAEITAKNIMRIIDNVMSIEGQ